MRFNGLLRGLLEVICVGVASLGLGYLWQNCLDQPSLPPHTAYTVREMPVGTLGYIPATAANLDERGKLMLNPDYPVRSRSREDADLQIFHMEAGYFVRERGTDRAKPAILPDPM